MLNDNDDNYDDDFNYYDAVCIMHICITILRAKQLKRNISIYHNKSKSFDIVLGEPALIEVTLKTFNGDWQLSS